MAKLSPTFEKINELKVPPTPGEMELLQTLVQNLDDSFEIYFQPFFNGDQPDIIVVRPKYCILIIEVKDWSLDSYSIVDGEWIVKNNNSRISSPIEQVNNYKFNLINLHWEGFFEQAIKGKRKRHYDIITSLVYFSKSPTHEVKAFIDKGYENKKEKVYWTKYIGNDIVKNNNSFTHFITYESGLETSKSIFSDNLYKKLYRYLKPPFHQEEEGRNIVYNKEQLSLIESQANVRQKIKGVAGCGKTLVLAKRAVNAHIRTSEKVLILTYNISLRNYIHDLISDVRESFAWGNFEINNYHSFFGAKANNYGVPISSLDDYDDVTFFENEKYNINKYSCIVIDEVQDYKTEWIEIITKYFLNDDGEFVVFGDEKQNIYDRPLENKEPIIRTIPGRWNKSLKVSFRFDGNIAKLAMDFQKEFLDQKYEIDEIVAQQDLFENQMIKYFNIEDKFDSKDYSYELSKIILDYLMNELRKNDIHPSDVAILSPKVDVLLNLDALIRNEEKEKTITVFEKLEDHVELRSYYGLDDPSNMSWSNIDKYRSQKMKARQENFNIDVKKIRRNKKMHFYMQTGTMKLSTIHSFKGWEIHTLVLLIEDADVDDEFLTEELIYTGLTRSRRNLIVINNNIDKYDEFFKNYLD